jgi:hypothetical protein
MKRLGTPDLKLLFVVVTVLTSVQVTSGQQAETEKPAAETIVSRHVNSIGTAEARAAVKSVMVVGTTKATFFGRGGGVADGISVLASTDSKYMVGMKFATSDYPLERMGYDGDAFTVGYVRPGVRSVLGSFLRTNEGSFKTGILTGTLSRSWALLNADLKEAKIKYSGTKKVNDKRLYALDYIPKKGSDLRITLYFEPETYRHVRTEYKRVIAARQGATADASAGQSETRYLLVEDFGDFATENNLNLPHSYRIFLEILSGNGTTSYEWLMKFQTFSFNQPIGDKEFKVDSY